MSPASVSEHTAGPEGSSSRAAVSTVHGRLQNRQSGPLYNTAALRLWLLRCCQSPRGGFRDKPGKPVDHYHTCYCLSGLSLCQELSGSLTLQPVQGNATVIVRPEVTLACRQSIQLHQSSHRSWAYMSSGDAASRALGSLQIHKPRLPVQVVWMRRTGLRQWIHSAMLWRIG